MRKLLALTFMLLFSVLAEAQKLSKEAQEDFLKMAASHNEVLEKSIMPDFTIAHPNKMYMDMACFPGKKISIALLTAVKPSDLQFKVTIGNQTFKPLDGFFEIPFAGKSYWVRNITIDMANASSGDYCMNLVAYDGNAIDLPVYIYFLSLH